MSEMGEMKKNDRTDIVCLAVGEAVVAALICFVYLAIGRFDYTVLTGSVLGAIVAIGNFIALSLSVNRIVENYIGERGDREMTDEEAEKFSAEHKLSVQNAMTKSYILRNVVMIAVLVGALITRQFDPISLLIPLVVYKPLIYLSEFIKKKRGM